MTRQRLNSAKVLLLLLIGVPTARAQQATPDLTATKLEAMSKVLAETQRQLEQTQQQLDLLRSQLEAMRAEPQSTSPAITSATLAEQVRHQQEEQEVLQAEVKQHDQTKIESMSKYPVRVYGLLLFNAFSNAGVVDNSNLPSAAIARTPDLSHGSVGGTFRQTLLGISASGPRLYGAKTSGDLSIDFFGDPTYNYYGSTNGNVRLRRADIGLTWESPIHPEASRDSRRDRRATHLASLTDFLRDDCGIGACLVRKSMDLGSTTSLST